MVSRPLKIMIIDDDDAICFLYKTILEQGGLFHVNRANSLLEMKQVLSQDHYDIVLLDLSLHKENGLDGLTYICHIHPLCKVVILTATNTIDIAVSALEQGAHDFILKSDHPAKICARLQNIATISTDKSHKELIKFAEKFGIYGSSAAIINVLKKTLLIKDVDSTVLLHGESGTGKELIARILHLASKRCKHNFAAINCGAIPENLLETELFGHRKGAFTDAKTSRTGMFEYCSGGTLLLDEISEMPIYLQVKLLRVLQEMEITPVGSNQSIAINTRIIAATNKNIRSLISTGRFREDLYFRLSVIDLKIPGLRERTGDIELLANHFIGKFNKKFGKNIHPITKPLLARLCHHPWPGNIRELQNTIERGVVMSPDNSLHLEDMFTEQQDFLHNSHQIAPEEAITSFIDSLPMSYHEAKNLFEEQYITNLLNISHGNIAEASRISGQYRANLYRMMQRHQISVTNYKSYSSTCSRE